MYVSKYIGGTTSPMSVQIVGSFLETVQGNLSVRGGEFETVGD